MIHDLAIGPRPQLPAVDLCIIGSGPAGLTLARELSGSGYTIAVLESGRRRPTRRGDELRLVQSEGIQIKEYSRERVLGGSSTAWSGLSAPLDAVDMEPRPWLQHSGWPLSRDELLPYWDAAAERYHFAPLAEYAPGGFDKVKAKGDRCPAWETLQEKVFLARAVAQDFGVDHGDVFELPGVDLYLDATVVRLCADGSDDSIQRAVLRTAAGQELEISASIFVLATGGLENPRLLLSSTDLCEAGLGNEHDVVGRYLMNHPKNYHGMLTLAEPTGDLPFYYGCLYKGFAGYAGLRLAESYQREEQLLNSYVRLEPLFPWTDSEGVEALVFFAKHSSTLMRRWTRGKQDEVVALRDYSETGDDSDVQNARKSFGEWIALAFKIPLDAPSVLRYLKYRLVTKAKPRIRRVRIRNFMEMEPCPQNRVVLTEELDVLGVRKPKVLHDSTQKDRHAVVVLHEHLKREFAEQGFGELETSLQDSAPWPINEEASHHLGTTRMGDDPTASVVDSDLRVHSAKNLFMAGASVFPTSGCANPTFTICALSIRLAEHLQQLFADSAEGHGQ